MARTNQDPIPNLLTATTRPWENHLNSLWSHFPYLQQGAEVLTG
jgi:hypothetical protein